MNRSQKILVIKVSYAIMFLFSILLIIFVNLPIETLAVILYPLITVLVLIWRSVRDDYDLFLLNKLVFDIDDNLNAVELIGDCVHRIGFRKIKFHKYQMKSDGLIKVHFDIANKGNSEVTLHDYQVKILYPQKELMVSVPLFETIRIYNPIESRITEEINYLRRKHLDRGGLHTCIFSLDRKYNYMILEIDINTYKCEGAKQYLLMFSGEYFFVARCKKIWLINRSEDFFVKHQNKIENFLRSSNLVFNLKRTPW
ncbi:MAG TPA: hypothetical protein VMV49_05110 [Candidatus Deferrimicrobium sp.]|nr:hypothetical protein [Candidatus Deferrimicrobium sp.]